MNGPVPALILALALASCSDIPRDMDGSLQQIHDRKSFRVGIVAGSRDADRRTQRLLQQLAKTAGARPEVRSGAAEPLLAQLEAGKLDLVVGSMAEKSPWRRKVHFLPALTATSPADQTRLVAMARNGENAWIALVHRQVERVRDAS